MQISIAMHIIGLVLWLGGVLVLTRLARLFVDATPDGGPTVVMLKKSWHFYVIHGIGITLLTGLFQLFMGGVGEYMKQGWFHTKLTFVLVLVATTIVLGLQISRISRGERASANALRWVQILSSISLVVIVFLMKVVR